MGILSQSQLSMRRKVFLIMGRPNQYPLNQLFNVCLIAIIFINVCAVILETVPSLSAKYATSFHLIEAFSVAIFSVEYFLRIWASGADDRYGSGLKAKLRYITSPFAIIDLIAILPSLVSIFWFFDLRMLRVVRLFRVVRLLRLARYSLAIIRLVDVFKRKRPELLVTFSCGIILIIFSSSLMYLVEHQAQPDKYSSIPATMWWSVATLTTIGYGDIYPITSLGKVLGSLIALIGVGLFALPAAILATGFTEKEWVEHDEMLFKSISNCPHCQKNLSHNRKNQKKAS